MSLLKHSLMPHHEILTTRRDFLLRSGAGFGALALTYLLQSRSSTQASPSPVSPKAPHFPARAKNVIFLFMEGGPSHLDTFDPKPLVNELAGNPLPESFTKGLITAMGEVNSPVLAAPRTWKQHGQSGLWVSEWFPHVAGCIDDIAVLRSCVSDGINHAGGVCQMNTGSPLAGRPSLGSWVNYGLGSENENLPAFVVLQDTNGQVVNGPRNWGTGFMPAAYQGIRFNADGPPVSNLQPPKAISESRQRNKLAYLQSLNQNHAKSRSQQSELEARIRGYELAYRMQAEAPEAVDLSQESQSTQSLYGMDEEATRVFGRNCLLARRLVERGVRFIQIYHGVGSKWDAHSDIEDTHPKLCYATDRPIAGLLKDLKQRGLLDETLVIWGGEFGRTPMSEKGDGRDHNPTGFTLWMAGGGVQGGQTIGATDEVGLYAVQDRLHISDLHATILHLLGLHNLDLIYHHQGRPETPTINRGEAYTKITRTPASSPQATL